MKDSIWSVLFKVLHLGISFITTILLARWLGTNEFGIYTFVLSIITVLITISHLGFPSLLTREIARAKSVHEEETITGVWRWSSQRVLFVSLITSCFLLLVSAITREEISVTKYDCLIIAVFNIPFAVLIKVHGGAIRGYGNVLISQMSDLVIRPILYLLTLIIILNIAEIDRAISGLAMFCYACATALSYLSIIIFCRNIRKKYNYSIEESRTRLSDWKKAALPLAFSEIFLIINSQAGPIFLGFLGTNEQVGIYRVVIQLSVVTVFVLQAINVVVMHRFTQYYTEGNIEGLQGLVSKVTRIGTFTGLIPAVTMIIYGNEILELIFGVEYTAGYEALVILLLAQVFNIAMGPVGILLNMTGNESKTFTGIVISTMVLIFLSPILIINFGINGAAFAGLISIITWNIILSWQVYSILGISSYLRIRI